MPARSLGGRLVYLLPLLACESAIPCFTARHGLQRPPEYHLPRRPRSDSRALLGPNPTSDTKTPNGAYTAHWGASRTRHPLGEHSAALETFSTTNFDKRLQLARPDRLQQQRNQDTRNRDGRFDRDRDPGINRLLDLQFGKTHWQSQRLQRRFPPRPSAPALVRIRPACVPARGRLGDSRAGMWLAGGHAHRWGPFFIHHTSFGWDGYSYYQGLLCLVTG